MTYYTYLLNIKLYNGEKVYTDNKIFINDSNFMDYILNDKKINNKIELPEFYQTKEFCFYLKNYFNLKFRHNFNLNNKFNDDNNDVFIHVRLGDVICYNPGLDYYDSILKKI